MQLLKFLRRITKYFTPKKGRSERLKFSLGKQPTIENEEPDTEIQAKQWSKNLDVNLHLLNKIFHVPDSSDIVIREISCAHPNLRVIIAFIDGLACSNKITTSVLQPLMLLSPIRKFGSDKRSDTLTCFKNALIACGQAEIKNTVDESVEAVLSGDTIVLIQGQDKAITVETKGWQHRNVQEAISERIVRGPQQGFVEVLRVNTALLRSMIRTPDLVVENIEVGVRTKTQCAIVYIKDLANPKITSEISRRIRSITIDSVLTSGKLEQLIETNSQTLFPTIISTERPDRTAHFILEGSVAILVSGDPFALLAPVTIFAFLHSPEDHYVRWPYGNVLRLIRVVALFIAILFPGIYIAITNYHPEMIPPVLFFSIAAAREMVPLPLPLEVLLMYFGFELIREAGIRIPSPFGQTMGIVGALLVGEAAVSASLVSPIMVIVIAITGVASFTIPNQEAGILVRVATLMFILVGSFLGLFGIVAAIYVVFCRLFSLTSLGIPFFAPIAPKQPTVPDIVTLGPVWKMEFRPPFLRPLDKRRQPDIVKQWDVELQQENKQKDNVNENS